jgi:hypothetical protein
VRMSPSPARSVTPVDHSLLVNAATALGTASAQVGELTRAIRAVDVGAAADQTAAGQALITHGLAALEASSAGIDDAVSAINQLGDARLVARAGDAASPALETWSAVNERVAEATDTFRQTEPATDTNAAYRHLLVANLERVSRVFTAAASKLQRLVD